VCSAPRNLTHSQSDLGPSRLDAGEPNGQSALVERPELHGPKDYLDAAKSPDATVDELDSLARSPYLFVDIAVAPHATTSPSTLEFLLTKTSPDDWNGDALLHASASNPNSAADVLSSVSERCRGCCISVIGSGLRRRACVGSEGRHSTRSVDIDASRRSGNGGISEGRR
jgi:hypothetical protein